MKSGKTHFVTHSIDPKNTNLLLMSKLEVLNPIEIDFYDLIHKSGGPEYQIKIQ